VDALIAFLRARLDEDERVARTADEAWDPDDYEWQDLDEGPRRHIGRHDPARVLAEVDAKRETLTFCEHLLETKRAQEAADELSEYSLGRAQAGGHMLRLLALPYASHPDYREEWRP
jgi:hypothetical protein